MLKKLLAKIYGLALNVLAFFSKKTAGEKAFLVFCTVRKGRVLPHQTAFLDAAKSEVRTILEHDIQTYHWPGKKDTVLLIHGWESNAYRWHKLIEKLKAAEFNIIAFDAPAHGYSSGKVLHVPLYEKIVQDLRTTYQPSFIIGHSVGGMTLMYHLHLHKEADLKKVVTIGAPSEFHEIISHYQALLGLNHRVMSALELYIKNTFGFGFKAFSTSKFAKENTKTGLLLHDKLDTITPYHCSEQVHANWKNSTLISTEGLGHSMHQDEINNKIVQFLES